MPRPDTKPRPAPLQINKLAPRMADLDISYINRQFINDLDPDDLVTMGDLGRGNGGTVTKVKHTPSNQVLARKVIRLEVCSATGNRIMQELEVLKDCKSEYIVGYFGAYLRNAELNIFMEYMDGRSLDTILQKFSRIPEYILGKITISVIKGLAYLRDNHNIMHRDIKPSNILVNSHGQIKICDFGVSVQLIESLAQSFVGTRQYMAPERLVGDPYSIQSDIWSMGLTLVELALGVYPIPQSDPLKMYESPDVSKGEVKSLPVFALMEYILHHPPPTIPGPPVFSAEFKNFLDRCLKREPNERFDLRTIMKDPFVIQSETNSVDVAAWVCRIWSTSPQT